MTLFFSDRNAWDLFDATCSVVLWWQTVGTSPNCRMAAEFYETEKTGPNNYRHAHARMLALP